MTDVTRHAPGQRPRAATRGGLRALPLICLLMLALVGVGACAEDTDEASPDAATAKTPQQAVADATPDPLATPAAAAQGLALQPSLDEQVALADPANLLSPDPTPWRPGAAVEGGTLRRAVPGLPEEYLWLTNNTTNVHDINAYLVETLARRHQEAPTRWAPQLAERITVSPDGRVYTIHLKRGVMWHPLFEGSEEAARLPSGREAVPLTSRDFAFTFDLLTDERIVRAAAARSWYSDCEALRVLDPYTFEMVWRQPGLGALIGTMTLAPLPEHVYAYGPDGRRNPDPALFIDNHWYIWPLGTGSYQLDVFDASTMRLVRNPRYHGPPPAIEAIDLQSYYNDEALDALLLGELDVVEIYPATYRARVLEAPPDSPLRSGEVRLLRELELGFSYIGWNNLAGPTADRRVRRALTMALDRERAIDEAFQGLGRVATGPFPSRSPDSDPGVAPLPFDLVRAATLLEEAGWVDTDDDGVREWQGNGWEELEIRVASFGEESWQVLFDFYAEDLARIGVRLVVTFPREELGPLLSSGQVHGFVGGWGMDWENDLYQVWHASQYAVPGGSNQVGYTNPRADRLIEQVRTTTDAELRRPLQHALHRLIHEDQPYTFVVEREMLTAVSARLRGVRLQRTRPHDMSAPWWIDPGAD